MRHLAAYLLLVSGGNAAPTAEDVKTLLGTVGVEVDQDRLDGLISDLEGKNLAELIELGKEQLCAGGAPGGGGGGAAPAAAGAPAAAPAEKAAEKPKEEEVDALDGGMDMFGGGGGGGGDY